MENASKALLIAAAVLIAIVLIAIGIKVLSSSQNLTSGVGETAESTAISIHNSQYTDFIGIQTGTQVRALLSKVIATHRGDREHSVNAVYAEMLYNSADLVSTLRTQIKVNDT